ncbi:EAL domain-containing response regulator [Leptothoe sp. ISB3NOV94-8A]
MVMPETSAVMTTILVIDDDADLATVFCDLLSLNGFTPFRATTGQDGLHLAQLHQPQLIVCDIGLPDIDGYEVLACLRSHPTTATIPIIMLTGHDVSDTFRRSMEHGADDYLTKPIDLQSFLRAVRAQLNKREHLSKYLKSKSVDASCRFTSAIKWSDLAKQLDVVRQSPWSSLWVIRVDNYDVLQTGYGHVFGKLFLETIGQQLHQWRECWNHPTISINTLAYVGANRFIVFLRALNTPEETSYEATIAQLKSDLQQPMVINNHRLIPDIHIEVVQSPESTTLKALKTTLNQVSPSASQPSLAERLKWAMQRNELKLYFQPQVELSSGQIIGAEALVRWIVPGEPPVLPVQFIPVAEEHGLMLPLGEWILETALQQLAHWQRIQLSGISIAVNLSAHQLRSSQFIDRLMTLVEAVKVNPVMVDLELPERLIMEDFGRAKLLLADLQSRGFSIAIDDFSFGSLGYLQSLPVNILKLDKCFVRDLHNNRSNQVIVRAIMEMARGLNISTIAGGVETARELSILKQLKCHSMQGYLFSPALSAKDFEKLLLGSSKRYAAQSVRPI